MNEFDSDSISPYSDEEAVKALQRVSHSPILPLISKFLFPDKPYYTFRRLLRGISSIEEFQEIVMKKVIVAALNNSSSGFSYSGIENINRERKFLAISNHRDIILDPALIQWTLLHNQLPMTEICVGSNLLESNKTVADLLRSNRMIKVIRGISAREMYLNSQVLSKYIRDVVVSGRGSVWVAQREGRTKNGLDVTEQGLLKMLDMSGNSGFKDNFNELGITPMSISYEYESCDIRKARELLISESQKYVKKKNEDMHSIMTGVKQWKGGIHLCIGKPLTEEEIDIASHCDKNDRYQSLRKTLDERILDGYKLWKTNYMGYDLMNQTNKYASQYTKEDLEAFREYTEHKLDSVERTLDRDSLRIIFWKIYGNPVIAKELINQ